MLLALNGVIVFSLEMIFVYILIITVIIHKNIFLGLLMVGTGFGVLNLIEANIILPIGMIILSVAEIFAMPFRITFGVQR